MFNEIITSNSEYEIYLEINNLDDSNDDYYQKYIVNTPYENFKFSNIFLALEFYEDQIAHSGWWKQEQIDLAELENVFNSL